MDGCDIPTRDPPTNQGKKYFRHGFYDIKRRGGTRIVFFRAWEIRNLQVVQKRCLKRVLTGGARKGTLPIVDYQVGFFVRSILLIVATASFAVSRVTREA